VGPEEPHRPRPERGPTLIGQLLGVGQARVVIDRGVDEDVAAPSTLRLGPGGCPVLG
jgi:hypothetical protein